MFAAAEWIKKKISWNIKKKKKERTTLGLSFFKKEILWDGHCNGKIRSISHNQVVPSLWLAPDKKITSSKLIGNASGIGETWGKLVFYSSRCQCQWCMKAVFKLKKITLKIIIKCSV